MKYKNRPIRATSWLRRTSRGFREKLRTLTEFFAFNTWLLFLIVAICVFYRLWLSRNTLLSKTDDILVEVVGFFLDIVFFGIILTIYEKWRSKKQQIREYYNQLRAFRTWGDEEGVLRKVDIIRQLTEEMKIPLPDMMGINLKKADLTEANLSGANLSNANLAATDLFWANLSGANMSGAVLFKAELLHTDLLNANLSALQ